VGDAELRRLRAGCARHLPGRRRGIADAGECLRPSAGAGASIGGGSGASVGRGGNPSFVLTNGTNATIREVYVSLSSDNNWGGDRLGANVLNPGQGLNVNLPSGNVCTVDIRVVYMNGQSAERRRVETCSISQFVWR
jgi:hypothetical protein